MFATIARKTCPIMLMLGATAAMAALPLKPGTFVLAGSSCHDPAFAAMFTYDGRHFSYPHASKCRALVRSHAGNVYRVEETCAALGDGSPATVTTRDTTYTIASTTHVLVTRGSGGKGSSYRWCAPS